MSDYLGEYNFNSFLKEYIGRTAFQEAPYTTSIEFVKLLKERTPDSLQYLVQDMFETITLYDNAIQKVTSKKIADNSYQVDIEFNVSKYRTDEKGKRSYEDIKGAAIKGRKDKKELLSLPLQDYIEIGVFGEQKVQGKFKVDHQLYLAKHKIDKVNNKITLYVSEKPIEVGVDPYNKLIDTDSDDNRKKI
jgi:ABC-2 type transport system permease protein